MDYVKALLQIIEGKLHSVITLIVVLVSEILLFVRIDDFISNFITNTTARGLVYFSLLTIWTVFWLFNRFYLPKNHKKKKKVGIVIAIFSENEIERQKLKADFISKLKEMFSQEFIDAIRYSFEHVFQAIVEDIHLYDNTEFFDEQIKKFNRFKEIYLELYPHTNFGFNALLSGETPYGEDYVKI